MISDHTSRYEEIAPDLPELRLKTYTPNHIPDTTNLRAPHLAAALLSSGDPAGQAPPLLASPQCCCGLASVLLGLSWRYPRFDFIP